MPPLTGARLPGWSRWHPVGIAAELPKRFQHGAHAGDFVRAEEIGFAQRSEDSEKRFGRADFITKILKGMWECMADREPQCAKPERVEERPHLMLNAEGTVLKIAIIETQTGIDEDAVESAVQGQIDLTGEILVHAQDGIATEIKRVHLADVVPFDITHDDGGSVIGREAVHCFCAGGPGKVEDVGTRGKAGARDGNFVGFDRYENVVLPQGAHDREQHAGLRAGIKPGRVREGGFGTDIHQMGSLRGENPAALDGGISIETDTFAIPGIGREIDDTKDRGLGIEVEISSTDVEFPEGRPAGGLVMENQVGEMFQRQHAGKGSANLLEGKPPARIFHERTCCVIHLEICMKNPG
jgi:hypothetical protein